MLVNKSSIGGTVLHLPYNLSEYIYNRLYDGLFIKLETGNLNSSYLDWTLLISFINEIFSNESLFIKYCFIISLCELTY